MRRWQFIQMLALLFVGCLQLGMGEAKKVAVKEVQLDSAVVDIHWVSDNNKIILVQTANGQLYRSTDSGESWDEITELLHAPSKGSYETKITVSRIHQSPALRSTILVTGTKKHNFVSTDSGATWTRIRSQSTIHTWIFHPTRPTWGLLSTWSEACSRGKSADGDCVHMLYCTRDLGRTFEPIKSYVVQFSWGSKELQMEDRIFFSAFKQKSGNQPRLSLWSENVDFAYTEVPKDGSAKRIHHLVNAGNKFLLSQKYIFVAKLKDHAEQTVNLLVSTDGGATFESAELPRDIGEKSYTILDTSEGAVIIHVYHGHTGQVSTGNIYISDAKGVQYSLSLPQNIRNADGDCEFDKILGLEGIYMGNFLDKESAGGSAEAEAKSTSEEEEEASASGPKRHAGKSENIVRTVISWNKGGSWHYLKAPRVNSRGQKYDCPENKCWLHLHGVSEYQSYAPFYSLETATGIIMGTGNVGPYLRYETDEMNTYMSRDGGLTWVEAHQGSYIYEFGDHGGLVVMADNMKKTKQVIFSWNEGQSWYDFDLGDNPLDVGNIVTEPNATATNFLLYGTRQGSGIIYHLNFATLGQPFCRGHWAPDSVSSDYESWTPVDGSGNKCLLGRQLVYTRRKPSSECFNGENFKRPVERMDCACTAEDFECNIGFTRDIESAEGGAKQQCHPALEGGIRYPDCQAGELVYVEPYRKVPGNQCVGGWTPEKTALSCPAGHLSRRAWSVLSVLALIVLGFALVTFISKNDQLKEWLGNTGLSAYGGIQYMDLNKASMGDGPVHALDEVGTLVSHPDLDDFIQEDDAYDDAPRLLSYNDDSSEPRPAREIRAAANVPRLAGPGSSVQMQDAMDLL